MSRLYIAIHNWVIHVQHFKTKGGFPPPRNFSVRTRVKKRIEAMYERPRINVKVESRSTLMFTRGHSYISSILIYFIYLRKIYQRSHRKITRQWKSTLTDLINREGTVVYSVRAVGRSVVSLPASWSLYRRQRRVAVKDCVFNLILFADKLYSISELFVSLCFESRSRKYLMLSFNEKSAAIWFKYTKRGMGFLGTVLWVLLLS